VSRGIVSVRESTELLRTAAQRARDRSLRRLGRGRPRRGSGSGRPRPDGPAGLASWREVAMASTHPDHPAQGPGHPAVQPRQDPPGANLHHSLCRLRRASWARQADMMPYLRNNNGMRDQAGPEDFGQQVEPWAVTCPATPTPSEHPPLQSGWERGTVASTNPLLRPPRLRRLEASLKPAATAA